MVSDMITEYTPGELGRFLSGASCDDSNEPRASINQISLLLMAREDALAKGWNVFEFNLLSGTPRWKSFSFDNGFKNAFAEGKMRGRQSDVKSIRGGA